MNPLRMGMIGCGAIAQIMHLPYMFEYDDRFKIVALADSYRPVLDAVGDHYGIANRYTDWREMLGRDDIEAVGIFHSGSHHDTTIAALDAGKHVLVEKPMTVNVREAQEVADRAAKSDRVVQLGYHKLYDPGYAYAREQVRQMSDVGFARITVMHPANELGFAPHRIRRGNGVIEEGVPDTSTVEKQLADHLNSLAIGEMAGLVDEALGERKSEARLRVAYSTLCSSIIHQLYTLYGFLGEPKRVISTDIWRGGLSIHTMIEYSDDLHVSLDWHFLQYLADYREEYAFLGHRERIFLQFPSPYYRNFPSPVIIQGGEGGLSWEKKITVSLDEPFRNEMLAFYDNVRQNKIPATSVADGLKHAKFIQQVIDAAP